MSRPRIAKEKVVFYWSGGKDSALALNRILNDPSTVGPVTCGTAYQGILVLRPAPRVIPCSG
jgi:hypothetical protein